MFFVRCVIKHNDICPNIIVTVGGFPPLFPKEAPIEVSQVEDAYTALLTGLADICPCKSHPLQRESHLIRSISRVGQKRTSSSR